MKLALSENIKEAKLILVHKLFDLYGDRKDASKQLGISVKTIRAWLKKPIPKPTQELVIDVTGMTLADVKEAIFRIVIGYDEKRAISSKRLGMSIRHISLYIKEYGLPYKRIDSDKIDKIAIIEQFADGYRLNDIMKINNLSYGNVHDVLFSEFGYRGYDDQIIENNYARKRKRLTVDNETGNIKTA
jgi:DNA-binding transcriptional MerR regulator